MWHLGSLTPHYSSGSSWYMLMKLTLLWWYERVDFCWCSWNVEGSGIGAVTYALVADHDYFMDFSYDSPSISFDGCLPSDCTILLLSEMITIILIKIFLDWDNFLRACCIHFFMGITCFIVVAFIMYVETLKLYMHVTVELARCYTHSSLVSQNSFPLILLLE